MRGQNERIRTFGLGFLITVLGFLVAYQFVEPAPPSTIRLATGSALGAYQLFGESYRKILARQGVTLELVPSEGSVANLRSLKDEATGIQVAFVQGGTAPAVDPSGLTALGSLFLEPLWVFMREGEQVDRLSRLKGRRLAVGAEGSGTRIVAFRLLDENGIGADEAEMLPLAGPEAHVALQSGEIDAALVVASPRAPLIEAMLKDESLRLMTFEQAEAYALRTRYLSPVRLPRGVVDLGADLPPADVTLVAPAAMMVARDDLHPALVSLLLQTARQVHGPGDLFETPGTFPSARFAEFPLSDEAERFLRSGPPLLQQYLPFWAANLVDRLKVMLIPVVTLLIPLSKILPPVYRWRVTSRISRWYRDLLAIETQAAEATDPQALKDMLTRLKAIDDEVKRLPVPLSYADAAYSLRMHIRLVRDIVDRQGKGEGE
ncbi:MAG: ABC transporter substrate-binding protein [Magnetospirillum sp. WYHS-4]